MVHGRIGFAVVCVILGCTVESGDGATSFGSAGMNEGSSGSSSPASEAGSGDASGNADEAGDDDPDPSSDPGSTSAETSEPGSDATSDPGGSEASSDPGGSEAGSGSSDSGGSLEEHDYGPCTGGTPKEPCGEDAECLVIEGLDGSFCSPWCDDAGQCPDPTTGEAFSACQLGPDLTMPPVHCALLCDPGSDECPDGMNCVDTGMPVGVCLFQG